jgi:hypothetical protein
MPNSFKYNVSSETLALKKGNFYIGTGDVDKGPTSSTGFWNGIVPPVGGYTIYVHKASGGPSINVASSNAQLISYTNRIANASYTTVAQCIDYYNSQTDKVVVSGDIGSIVTDRLSLCLLPQNVISYASGSSSWYDVASGLTFTSYGSLLSYGNLGGYPGFAFNGSGYWQCDTNYSQVDLGGDCTVILWIYGSQGGVRKTIFEKIGTSYASYQQELALTWEVGSGFTYYSRHVDYDYAGMGSTTPNAWCMMALQMSTGKTSAARTGAWSKDGSAWTTSYTSRTNTALIPAGPIRIGTGYAGTCDSGGVGSVICYNKRLSDREIAQVYNATKSSYGL